MSSIKDYDNFFEPNEYLNFYHKNPELMKYGYEKMAKFWSQNKGKDLKVLEYGNGPVVSRLISACPYVKYFVLAEYLESNRKAVQAWIDKDPKAFDWRPTFDFIVRELEGKEPDEVPEREEELRQKIRAIVPCDLKAGNILDVPDCLLDKYGPPYDVVASSWCVEDVVESNEEYKRAVKKLANLVKPGGYLLILGALEENYYMVATKKFYCFYYGKELVEESMKEAGLKDVHIDLASCYGTLHDIEELKDNSDAHDMFFAWGRRVHSNDLS